MGNLKNEKERLRELAESYTPEWNFDEKNPDAGSALGILIADMFRDSAGRLEKAMYKHRIGYLNRFDALVREPVAAARGYVQFRPVAGSRGLLAVPKGTELSADSQEDEIIFETTHDICLADAGVTAVIMADGKEDRIVFAQDGKGERLESFSFKAFDTSGRNMAKHQLIIGFSPVLDGLSELSLSLRILAEKEEDAKQSAAVLASDAVEIGILEPRGEEEESFLTVPFDRASAQDDVLQLYKANYTPCRMKLMGREGYFLSVQTRGALPELVLSGLTLGLEQEEVIPDTVRFGGVDIHPESFSPFGAPLQLLSELELDSAEALSKKNASVTLSFELDYEVREEKLELADVNIDYKAIMKRPAEAAYARAVPVHADRIAWEYLSVKGWKRLPVDAECERMMNGEKKGRMQLDFICPEDIQTEESGQPRLRVRLLEAENIYKVPAVYQCPVIRHPRFSYTYKDREQEPMTAYSMNNYQYRELLSRMKSGIDTSVFYNTEQPGRCMYLCFDESVQGLPFSLYFDLENYSDLPMDFTVEYSRKEDFKEIRIVDGTNGMLNAGTMQFLISSDMEKRTLFGIEGYFLRFTGYEKAYPNYRLPYMKGIYPNVAKVENQNTIEEYFYIEDRDEELTVKLNHENIRQLSVWVREQSGPKAEWIRWRQASRSYEQGRVYQADMAAGTVSFGRFTFSDIPFAEEGPHIRVRHRDYRGEEANLPENTIVTMRDSNRYVSAVTNPFPSYGGYDAYTEESTAGYITGLLRSRNRAVTERDILDLLRQTSYSVERIKCGLDVDALGNPAKDRVTVAVLIRDYDKGTHIFHELKEQMRRQLEENGSFRMMGREVQLTQPHFLRVNVRLWLWKDTMENAYDLQNQAEAAIRAFIDPLTGGLEGQGWEIGSFPRVSQLKAYLGRMLKGAQIARLTVTALVEERETEIKEDVSDISRSPFILPINGEHVIHINLK